MAAWAKAGWRAAWAVVVLTAATRGAAEDGVLERAEVPAVLAVRWLDPSGALPIPHDAVAGELRALLASAGVALAWQPAAAGEVSAGSEVRVVLLAREASTTTEVMGSVQRGSPTRTAWINLPCVLRTLGLRGAQPRWHAGWPAALARALARVIAHELVHLLAPRMPHAERGLMAARLGRRFLTDAEAPLSHAVAAALRGGASAASAPSEYGYSEPVARSASLNAW